MSRVVDMTVIVCAAIWIAILAGAVWGMRSKGWYLATVSLLMLVAVATACWAFASGRLSPVGAWVQFLFAGALCVAGWFVVRARLSSEEEVYDSYNRGSWTSFHMRNNSK